MRRLGIVGLCLSMAVAGCAWDSGSTTDTLSQGASGQLPRREGRIVFDGCVMDTWQRATLAGPGARRVASEIIVLCLVPRADGTLGPRDPSAQATLRGLFDDLRRQGYRVTLAISFTDESGQRYDGNQTAGFLADPVWRARLVSGLGETASAADGVEIDLQHLPNRSRDDVTALVAEISAKVRPKQKLGVFVPPSIATPSDLPGGDAFSIPSIAPLVDRIHVSTLDFSDQGPGPTIDPGWAVDAVRLARRFAPANVGVDISYPLYGTDFGPRGTRSVTWTEAMGVARSSNIAIDRGPTSAPFFEWTSPTQERHVMWFDDARSTSLALGAWTYDVLPQEIGVVFYGLGAEEPGLFEQLAARTP